MTQTRDEKIEAHWQAQCASLEDDSTTRYVSWEAHEHRFGQRTVLLDGDFDVPLLEAVIATLRFRETL